MEKDPSSAHTIYNRPGMDIFIGMNVLNLKPTGITRDSLDLNSLMFPETGTFGVMIAPIFHWYYRKSGNAVHRISSELSYSLRHNKVSNVIQLNSMQDTVFGPAGIEFTVTNINVMPFRYNFHYVPNKDLTVDFNFGIYYHIFNIPNEDASAMNRLFDESNPLFREDKGSYINSIGFKFSCGANGFHIFADIRQNLNTTSLDDGNIYKGMVYNAGIAQNIHIFRK